MDKRWSTFVQTPIEIDTHREIRFADRYKEQMLSAIGAKPGMTIADIGCGAGTLTRKLSKWLGDSTKIIGIDRDSGFIEYCINKVKENRISNIEYYNADAYSIPLPDNSLDATTSHTVIEHVDHQKFLSEQRRIVKPGGTVSFMSVRSEKSIHVKHDEQTSDREKELLRLVDDAFNVKEINNIIAQHPIRPDAMPRLMHNLGFSDISIDGIAITVFPDDYRNSFDYKRRLISEEFISEMEIIKKAHVLKPCVFTKMHFEEMAQIINMRSENRLDNLMKDIKSWDFSIDMIIVVSGKV